MAPLRILVADQDEIIRQLLAGIISAQPAWEVCGEAKSVEDLLEKVRDLAPDIILLDVGLPYTGGIDATRQIVKGTPEQKIIILGFDDSQAGIREAFEAGALAYVLKAHATRDLIAAVRALEEGRTFFTSRIAEILLRDYVDRNRMRLPDEAGLDGRQKQAIKFLAREAATVLSPPRTTFAVSPGTVKKMLIIMAVVVSAGFGWSYYRSTLEQKLPVIDTVLETSGLKSPAPPANEGNPELKVWIDLQTGLYYCPGDKRYRKTPKGRLVRQQEARMDQFQPANRQPCE